MKRVLFIPVLILLTAGCGGLEQKRFGRIQTDPVPGMPDGVETAAVCRLASGDWLMLAGVSDPASADGVLFVLKSEDEGRSWSGADTAAVLSRPVTNLHASRLPDGGVIVLYSLLRSRRTGAAPQGCFLIRSYDHGRTFTTPQPVAAPGMDGLMPSGGICEGPAGEWIFPGSGRREGRVRPVLLLSDDLGNTWQVRTPDWPDSPSGEPPGHPAFAVQEEGGLICLFETGGSGYLHVTRTADWGQNWTLPGETPLYGIGPRLLSTRHGTLAVVYRDLSPEGLTLRLSYDLGRSWEPEMPVVQIAPGGGADGLLALIETEDGVALLWTRENRPRITRVRIGPPPIPKGVAASVKGNAVSIRWNAVDHAAFYLVCRDTTPDFSLRLPELPESNLIGMSVQNRFEDARIDSGLTVYYRVCGVRGSGPLIQNTGSIGELSDAVRVVIP